MTGVSKQYAREVADIEGKWPTILQRIYANPKVKRYIDPIVAALPKNKFLNKYLEQNHIINSANNKGIFEYFNKYEAFCFDLSSDSVLKGELKFNYK